MASHRLSQTKIFIDGVDISEHVRTVEMRVSAHECPETVVTLRGIPSVTETPGGIVISFGGDHTKNVDTVQRAIRLRD